MMMERNAVVMKGQAGFSLVELMIVVAIIGVLAALAVPKFATFQAKAKQTEAKTSLSHLYTLQEAVFGETDAYVALATTPAAGVCAANALGFQPKPCAGARYAYTIPAGGATYVATAAAIGSIVTGCATKDTWTMTEGKVLKSTIDAVALCI